MADIPEDKCGFMFPEDHQIGDRPVGQSCCYRDVLPDTDRCPWHAHPEETDEKTIDSLQHSRVPPDIRENTHNVAEIIDGAILSEPELNDSIALIEVSLRGADLTDANLFKANLSASILTVADLSEANLRGADLSDTRLKDADLSDAALRKADLSNSDMRGADLSHADLSSADLSDAELRDEADLSHAKLRFADLTGAFLYGADLSNADLSNADLSAAYLKGADLTGAVLEGADLSDAYLEEADLTDAQLFKADLSEASLIEADLTEADLRRADLTGAILDGTKLAGSNFHGAQLQKTRLPAGDVVKKSDLTEASLQGQDLRGEDLSGANLEKANLTDANLSGADLSGAILERALLNRADLFDTRFAGARLQGTVFGDAQINEGMFKELSSDPTSTDRGLNLSERLKRLMLGPTGHDAYRCVYDPKNQFVIPESEDVETDQFDKGGGDEVNNNLEAANRKDNRNQTEPETDKQEEDGLEEDDPEVRAGSVYRQFESIAKKNALPTWERRFFILRQDMQTFQKSGFDRAFALIQRGLFGYGESFGRVVGWSGGIIGLFAVLYLAGGWIQPVEAGGVLGPSVSWTRLPHDPSVLWESLYYSTLTFTSLGFGDFRPTEGLGQLFTILETATGALLLALLVYVLGRRAAR